jgi:hypothetical protein
LNILSDIFATERAFQGVEGPPGKILVVSSCTKDKLFPRGFPDRLQLLPEQLWDEQDDDPANRDFGELECYRSPAVQLYRGRQHQLMMQGVDLLRKVFGPDVVDVKIISAGFGLVDEDQLLPPYNATFADRSAATIQAVARRLGIPQKMSELVRGPYDCAFFLLGESYLLSLGLPFSSTPAFPCLFLTGPSSRKRVPRRTPYYFVRVGQDDAMAFSYNLVGLKGQLFKLFADQIASPNPQTPTDVLTGGISSAARLKGFLENPTPRYFLDIVSPFRQPEKLKQAEIKSQAKQSSLFAFTKNLERPKARNYDKPMRYFLPDWDDLVDPGYNFEIDAPAPGRRRYHDEVYAHQLYDEPNYDGLLFSKGTVEDGRVKTALVRELGIHKFARFEGPILGDCGAFSYITMKEPPYHTKEILDYYQNLGFDYGVSIDHLIIPAFYAVRDYRYQLTRNNAREFLTLHRAGNYSFTPVGVAQGWSPETYRNAVVELLDWGYSYIGLGGLARVKTEEILNILEAIAPVLERDTDLHLFGVARDREKYEMEYFRRLGVTSFDSASYLRRAWMSATTNYFTDDRQRYAALRISPVYDSSPRVRSIVADGLATVEQLKRLERDALLAVRDYDRGRLNLETALDVVLEIDRLEEYNYEQHRALYRRVLEDMPWKKCSCEICRQLGVEVILFRGNDRNRRRGFHNTYVFYKRFRRLMESMKESAL